MKTIGKQCAVIPQTLFDEETLSNARALLHQDLVKVLEKNETLPADEPRVWIETIKI